MNRRTYRRSEQPRPGYERLLEIASQELRQAGHSHGQPIRVSEFPAIMCRASRRLLAERS